jgi:predicted protein tyrosine phosphatase
MTKSIWYLLTVKGTRNKNLICNNIPNLLPYMQIKKIQNIKIERKKP